MHLSVMSWSFNNVLRTGEMDTAAVIAFVRGLGVGAIELMDGFITDDQLPAIEAALTGTHCAHVCYDVGADFVTPDRSRRQDAVKKVIKGLERGARLGASRALVVPGVLKEGISPAVARSWIIECLKECVPDASRLGMTLTIEDHSSQAAVYGRSDHLNAICDAVGPSLQVVYDVGNFLLAGEDPIAAVDRLGDRIVHVHLKDWRLISSSDTALTRRVTGLDGQSYTGAVLGKGIVDLPGALVRLQHIGYAGYISVEYEGRDDPCDAVREGVSYVRTQLNTKTVEE